VHLLYYIRVEKVGFIEEPMSRIELETSSLPKKRSPCLYRLFLYICVAFIS
jgi:hypothetical protein